MAALRNVREQTTAAAGGLDVNFERSYMRYSSQSLSGNLECQILTTIRFDF